MTPEGEREALRLLARIDRNLRLLRATATIAIAVAGGLLAAVAAAKAESVWGSNLVGGLVGIAAIALNIVMWKWITHDAERD